MKKAITLLALGSLAAGSFGCALTDYPPMGVHNKSHGAIGCSSDDRIANTQNTLEAQTRSLLYTSTLGEATSGACSTGFNPGVTLNTVSHQDARDWNRFIADYMFFAEIQVFGSGAFAGTWAMAGLKDLDDGSRRINTWYRPQTGAFSCIGADVDGRYGGGEGYLVADGLTRLPGFSVETIAVDNRAGSQFCSNIAAVDPNRAAFGYSTYWSFLGRAYEGRLSATPITRREGLASVLSGGTMDLTVQGVTVTVRGSINQNGSISADILGASANGVSYQAQNPVRLTIPAIGNFKTVKVENATDAEAVRGAEFAILAGLTDRTWNFQDTVVPELGVTLPPVELLVTEAGLRNFIDGAVPGTDRFGN